MCFPCSFHLQNIGDCVCFCFNKCFYLKYWTKKIIIVILKILSQSMSLQCNSNYFMCIKKATSNNPVMDDKITSGLKSSKIHVLEHCMPSSAPVFFSQLPVSRHLPQVDTYMYPWSRGFLFMGGSTEQDLSSISAGKYMYFE